MMDFSAFIAQSASYATINVYLAGIRLEHIERGFSHPFDDSRRLKLLLRDIRRKGAYTHQFHLSISIDVFLGLKRSLCDVSVMNCYDSCLMSSACTLAFIGFLRCAEFVATDSRRFSDTDLQRFDVSTSGDSFLVFLRISKTESFRLGHTVCIYPSGRSVCAVRALYRFLEIREGTPGEPLFRHTDGAYLTRRLFTTRLRYCYIQPASRRYSTHVIASASVQQQLLQLCVCFLG